MPPQHQTGRAVATIVKTSKGEEVANFQTKKAYWVMDQYGVGRVYIFERANADGTYTFTDRATRSEHCFDLSKSTLSAYKYIEVGESIVRAQKAFMTIELDHGTVFSYAALMELSFCVHRFDNCWYCRNSTAKKSTKRVSISYQPSSTLRREPK